MYALATDHPHRVDRVALAEIPGSPVVASSPPLFVPEPVRGASRGAERRLYDPDPEAAGILSEAASSASVAHLQSYSTDLRQIRCASNTGQVAKGAVSHTLHKTSSSGHADHPSGPVGPCCSGAGSIGSSSSSWAFALALASRSSLARAWTSAFQSRMCCACRASSSCPFAWGPNRRTDMMSEGP
jgi:hypothetical protein